MLPLDLHVLSLPLAFILSQDQTLHCIFYNISSLTWHLIILSKELTLLDKLFFSVLASCTVEQSFQWTCWNSLARDPFFVWGCKGTLYFLISKLFWKNFSIFISKASVLVRTHGLVNHPFFIWDCKGTLFFITSKFFRIIKTKKITKYTAARAQSADSHGRIRSLQFC